MATSRCAAGSEDLLRLTNACQSARSGKPVAATFLSVWAEITRESHRRRRTMWTTRTMRAAPRSRCALSFVLDDIIMNYLSLFLLKVFDGVVRPLLDSSFLGFNCSLFSYGQTGSGKTHTLVGESNGDNRGIIPRSMELIFQKKHHLAQDEEDPKSLNVKISVLEIYKEKLKDLLISNTCITSSSKRSMIRLREHINGTIWVEGLTEYVVENVNDFMKLLSLSLKRRVVGSHNMNQTSSRSHLIFIIHVGITRSNQASKSIASKIHIIDLAGSEMVRKTDATGARFNEAKHINKSLSALGNVISTLSHNSSGGSGGTGTGTGTGAPQHVPYRDSKLTRLLQNSLGGQANTLIILAVNSHQQHLAESVSTLKFGQRYTPSIHPLYTLYTPSIHTIHAIHPLYTLCTHYAHYTHYTYYTHYTHHTHHTHYTHYTHYAHSPPIQGSTNRNQASDQPSQQQ